MLQSNLRWFSSRLNQSRRAQFWMLFAWGAIALQGQAPPAQNSADAQAILHRASIALDRSDALRMLYTYREFTEEHSVDSAGKPKDVHTKLQDVLYLGERRYQHLLAKDGRPLDGATAKREEQRMQRAVSDAEKLTPAEREALRAKAEHDRQQNNEFWKYIPAAYTVSQLQDDSVNGRAMYVLSLTPRSEYHGKYSSFLNRIKARLFVDKQDDMLARVEADIIDDVSIGFVLARISKGTHFSYALTRINDEVWLPKEIDLQGSIRFLLKSMRGEERTTFSDYRKYQADSRIVATSVP